MQAYFDLIRENKTTKVSVSDIARKADIDRKTFYLHFDSVDQVLEKYIDERVTYIDSLLEENNYFSDPFDVEKDVFRDRYQKRHFRSTDPSLISLNRH